MNLLSSSLEMLQHELLLFGAIWLLIGAIDDLSIDGIWLVRRAYRRLVFYRARPPMTADDLPPPVRPGLLAIFVPTWAEANCWAAVTRTGAAANAITEFTSVAILTIIRVAPWSQRQQTVIREFAWLRWQRTAHRQRQAA